MGLKYYADMKDAHLSDLLRQANINTKRMLMPFSDYSCQDCIGSVRSIGAYMIFYQGGTIEHSKNVPGPVPQ